MTVAEFKRKWLRYQGKETSAYQEHFNDLCSLLGLPSPAEADPTGSDWFCFQKRVVKDLELFSTDDTGAEPAGSKRGFADVWRKGTPAQRDALAAFQKQLATTTVLDPACGSGNFLYLSLQLLLGLEKEVLAYATQLGFKLPPKVGVQQLRAIEINPYAYELAQVSVQIGYLQWRRDNGFDNDRTPVLQNLDGFRNEDALLEPHFGRKPRNLKEARADEHNADTSLKFYTEREWPKCDIIIGNPPFLGDKLMRGELGDSYVSELRRTFAERIPGQSDLCCYWFEKARKQIEKKECKRAGLLATQGIRGGANREVLKRIKQTGDIFFAVSDREWILAGAMVHVSMIGFDGGEESSRCLDGSQVNSIPANLSRQTDITSSANLRTNTDIGFIGISMHGPFDMDEAIAQRIIASTGNPNLQPNSDVVRPVLNALEITKRADKRWLISFRPEADAATASQYEAAFKFVAEHVQPVRAKNNRKAYRDRWWLPGEARPALQTKLSGIHRFIATPRVSKHRVFVWITPECLPSDATVAFTLADEFYFGVLHSRIHEVWSLAQGTQLREKESGFRYTPTTCFETFPFPFALKEPTPLPQGESTPHSEAAAAHHHFMGKEGSAPYGEAAHRAAIAVAAKELNDLRESWLNPPEWTKTVTLEFPGSVGGPWARFLDPQTVDARTGVGTVRYPRLEPRDAQAAAELKKRTLTALYNERPAWLDHAHRKLDAAVAAAYGWPADLSDEQILERLLALNLARAAAESATAAKPKSRKPQREKSADELL